MFLATDEDRDLAKRVIIDEYKDTKQVLTDALIASKVDEVINISYSIGGSYELNTLRKIVQSIIKRENL